MAEYIERESAIAKIREEGVYGSGYSNQEREDNVVDMIESIPSADVRPVVRGKWIDRDDKYYGWNMWACSACGKEFVLTEGTPDTNECHFCPNCGADMREEQDGR